MTPSAIWTLTPLPPPVLPNTTGKPITSVRLDVRKALTQIPRNILAQRMKIRNIIRMKGNSMIKKFVFALLLVMFLFQLAVPVAFAADQPVGSCPTGFHLDRVMDHDEHHHQHVGTDTDLNGDGWLCMRHVTPDETIHLHVDNYLP
jgi:hypothetical protein